jgi:hypothetical protein
LWEYSCLHMVDGPTTIGYGYQSLPFIIENLLPYASHSG